MSLDHSVEPSLFSGRSARPTAHALQETDLLRIFGALPHCYLLLAPDLTIADANQAYTSATMTLRENIIGQHIFDVFPDNPADPTANGVSNLERSLRQVIQHRRPHMIPIQRYDIRRPDGVFEKRYWRPSNTPILDDSGGLKLIAHHAEDVTREIREAVARQSMVHEAVIRTHSRLWSSRMLLRATYEQIESARQALHRSARLLDD